MPNDSTVSENKNSGAGNQYNSAYDEDFFKHGLKRSDRAIWVFCAERLYEDQPDRVLDFLIRKMLNDKYVDNRSLAAGLLGEIGDPRALRELAELRDLGVAYDEGTSDRDEAARSIEKILKKYPEINLEEIVAQSEQWK
jgi:hypothetical protein